MLEVPGQALDISIHAPRTGSDARPDQCHGHAAISIHAPRTGSDPKATTWSFLFSPISIHAPRTGSDLPCAGGHRPQHPHFNPRSPHGERRAEIHHHQQWHSISIHAPRTGSDGGSNCFQNGNSYFNPRSPHGERRQRKNLADEHQRISIHAPRTGSDLPMRKKAHQHLIFQSTLPARGATFAAPFVGLRVCGFQSTLPARGATASALLMALAQKYFNPRSPHGERRLTHRLRRVVLTISIHAPRTGSDSSASAHTRSGDSISIHAPRTGSDEANAHTLKIAFEFQSTLPARGATARWRTSCGARRISIHAPRTGSDAAEGVRGVVRLRFQSTLPARGATPVAGNRKVSKSNFNPRSPHGERHPRLYGKREVELHFNPRSPHGERQEQLRFADGAGEDFNPRSPHGERPCAAACGSSRRKISIHAPRRGSDGRERVSYLA